MITANGTVETEAFTIGSTGINVGGVFTSVYSPDSNQFYVAGFNGLYYFPSFTQSASLQGNSTTNFIVSTTFTIDAIESFGGNLYGVGGGNAADVGASCSSAPPACRQRSGPSPRSCRAFLSAPSRRPTRSSSRPTCT